MDLDQLEHEIIKKIDYAVEDSTHDDYLDDFILPQDNHSGPFPYSRYLNKLDETKPTPAFFQNLRDTYIKELKKAGYSDADPKYVLFGFPIDASSNKELLGCYFQNLPICKYLQKSINENFLELKLDGSSEDHDLNTLSSILRENINFQNVTVYLQIDKSNNNIVFSHMEYYGSRIDQDSELWVELLQSVYTELVLIIEIEHAIWHLIVAHIVYLAKRSLFFTDILKIFEMADDKVFIKALEVKYLLFGTNFVFRQVLNHNKRFIKYRKEKIERFIRTFDINTIYYTYFNIDRIGYEQINWIPGMKSNIDIIKNFVFNIVSKSDLSKQNKRLERFMKRKYSKFNMDCTNPIKKFLEILFVVGAAFHSTTFEFSKLFFTDVFYNKELTEAFYNIGIQTITTDINTVFGDTSLYSGKFYLEEVKKLYNDIQVNRERICVEMENNTMFKNNIFSTKSEMLKYIATNTYTTYV